MKLFTMRPVLLKALAAVICMLVCPACSHAVDSDKDNNPIVTGLNEFTVTKSVAWAKPDGISLTMDIYTPKTGKQSYPVLIIFHGGGWLINNNSTMDSMATYIVQHGGYVVCNVNYRLLGDDGNTVTMNQILEDAMGAVAWIKEFIAQYGGDPGKLIITGDSAGGQMAAMVVLSGHKLESDGFAGGSLGFKPTYLPANKTAEQLAAENFLSVKAAIISYGATDIYGACLGGMESSGNIFWMLAGKSPRGIFGSAFTPSTHPEMYKAVSPIYCIPLAAERRLPPQFCLVGSKDNLIYPSVVAYYVSELQRAGQQAEYWVHEGRPHAFLDSGKNDFLGTEFRKDAPPALDKMIEFMNRTVQ